jgi:multimeric flavodoxin WrbA
MKRILALICSPRKLGNCELSVKELCRNLSQEHELRLLRLSDFEIQACTGCYTCLFKKGQCKLKDDLGLVLEEMVKADAFILAAPTYFLGPNATLKNFLDRGLCFYAHADKLWGKPSIGLGLAGIPGKEGYTLLGLENFLKVILSQIKGIDILYGAMPGEVLQSQENKKKLKNLAHSLFSPQEEPEQPCCPLCGGKTFRFLKNNKVKCMLCSNQGQINLDNGKLEFEIKADSHDLFLSRESAIAHQEWLKGMKDKFKQKKDELLKISADYQKDGHWVRPKE